MQSALTYLSVLRRLKALFLSSLLFASSAIAGPYVASGSISVVRSHDPTLSADWFSLTGVSTVGTCGTYNGLVLFMIEDNENSWRHFAIALAAKSKSMAVNVQVDDSKKTPNGFCILQFIEI
jgi:hypothetical protein